MNPSDLIKWYFLLFVSAPVLATIVAFKGAPSIRWVAQTVLLVSAVANAAATAAFVRHAFARPSSGIGNQVLLLAAFPVAFLAILWFWLWKAARRHAYVQSLPPGQREYAELEDIERALEAARDTLVRTERRLEKWLISSEERERLRDQAGMLRASIAHLELERAKRL
ncbi:MAG TPA: hypothetical protein VEP66_17085 [Myxococcales bacterium]|nr:hypothetical protein [Myxococcales bacterium]